MTDIDHINFRMENDSDTRNGKELLECHGFKTIFNCFVDFENKLHKTNCIHFLPLNGGEDQVPKLYLELKDKSGNCSCCENFLEKVICTLNDVPESKLVHIFKVYLQGHVRHTHNNENDITCRLVSHLQDICITKRFSDFARYCFQINMTPMRLKMFLTERFDVLSDKITAVIISEMDSESVRSIFSESGSHEKLKIIMMERSESITKLLEKLVKHTDQADYIQCKILEMDDECWTPNDPDYNFCNFTAFQQIAYRGIEDAVCNTAYQILTNKKWENWCKRAFAIDAVVYLFSIVLLTIAAVTGVNAPNVLIYQSPIDYLRAICEAVLLLNAARMLVIEIYQAFKFKKEYLVDKMNIVEITSPVMLLLLLPIRYIHEQTHWYIYAVAYLVWLLQTVKYAPVFQFTGVYVDSLQKMFVKDILRFAIFLFMTIVVFSGTFLLVLKAENTLQLHEETMSFWKIGIVGIRILIESDSIVEYTGDEGYKIAGAMVMMIFMFFIIVVLLNMLIAQLINTYQDIESSSLKGFLVRRAKIVARLEREHMPCHFNVLNKNEERKKCYEEELKIDDDENNMSDTGIIHDDSLTIQQNIEARVKNVSNTCTLLNDIKEDLNTLRSNCDWLGTTLCDLLEIQQNEFANLHMNVDAKKFEASMARREDLKVRGLTAKLQLVETQLKTEKRNLEIERQKYKNLKNKRCFICKLKD